MGHCSPPEFLVLHALRLKGFAQPEAISTTTGVPSHDVQRHLDAAHESGHAMKRDGRLSGWALTPAGRQHHAALLNDDVERAGSRDKVDAAYRQFLDVNGELLGVCTDWQMRVGPNGEQTLNDHSDPIYDKAVI